MFANRPTPSPQASPSGSGPSLGLPQRSLRKSEPADLAVSPPDKLPHLTQFGRRSATEGTHHGRVDDGRRNAVSPLAPPCVSYYRNPSTGVNKLDMYTEEVEDIVRESVAEDPESGDAVPPIIDFAAASLTSALVSSTRPLRSRIATEGAQPQPNSAPVVHGRPVGKPPGGSRGSVSPTFSGPSKSLTRPEGALSPARLKRGTSPTAGLGGRGSPSGGITFSDGITMSPAGLPRRARVLSADEKKSVTVGSLSQMFRHTLNPDLSHVLNLRRPSLQDPNNRGHRHVYAPKVEEDR